MQVICLEEAAIYELFDQIVEMLRATQSERLEKRLPKDQAMQLLNIKLKTILQKLQDEGKTTPSQQQKK